MKPKSVQEYIRAKPKAAQQRLNELRSCLLEAAPEASEVLKWGKPAVVQNGILFVYSASREHISLHPTPSVILRLRDELGPLISSDSTIHFPLHDPIPGDLVRKIAERRLLEKEEMGAKWK